MHFIITRWINEKKYYFIAYKNDAHVIGGEVKYYRRVYEKKPSRYRAILDRVEAEGRMDLEKDYVDVKKPIKLDADKLILLWG